LVVEADGVLAAAIAPQGLQAIARRHAEESQFDRGIEQLQLGQSSRPKGRRQAAGATGGPQLLGVAIGKTPDLDLTLRGGGYSSSG
jgi:hypothetical protein